MVALRFADAQAALSSPAATATDDQAVAALRARDYARALALLNAPPKTREKIQRAENILASLAAAPHPADDLHLAAAYYLARIRHIHAFEPQPAEAAQRYERLAAEHPGSWWGQLAWLKRAIMRIYEDGSPAEGRAAALALGPEVQNLTDPTLRTCAHLTIGNALLRLGGPRLEAYRHLRAAAEAGIAMPEFRADTAIQVADLALEFGEPSVAIRFYRQFLTVFPRDGRAAYAEAQLGALAPRGELATFDPKPAAP